MKNIFVGNLSFNTNEDEVRQLFESYGQVDRVSIMTDRDTGRSRGFGFVEMTNNEDGEKAIAALNGSQLGGRTINVNEARPKAERLGGGGGGGGATRNVVANCFRSSESVKYNPANFGTIKRHTFTVRLISASTMPPAVAPASAN